MEKIGHINQEINGKYREFSDIEISKSKARYSL